MAHIRTRHALSSYQQLCHYSPLVGVFGHRQVGKTTFISDHVKRYVTLDDEISLKKAQESAKKFLEENRSESTAIDECQYAPQLFPALKEWVRIHKKPGQFILTGSVRFSSRKAIKESLTGRLVSVELFPMVLSELLQTELPETLPQLLQCSSFQRDIEAILQKPTQKKQSVFLTYLEKGGLPGLCFTRTERLQFEGISSLINLILDRDLRLIIETRLSLETLKRFLKLIAQSAWQPYRFSEVQRKLGISEVTQKKLLYAFESIYLIRKIPFIGTQGSTYLLEDQLEERFLAEDSLPETTQILGCLYRNLRAQLGYRLGISFEVDSYRTRGGARVPLVFRSKGQMIGIIPISNDTINLSEKRSADSFLRQFPEAKVICASKNTIQTQVMDSRLLLTAAASLC